MTRKDLIATQPLIAGEDLGPGPCHIKASDGKVYTSTAKQLSDRERAVRDILPEDGTSITEELWRRRARLLGLTSRECNALIANGAVELRGNGSVARGRQSELSL